MVGPGTSAERLFSAAGVSEYRDSFHRSRCVSTPAMRPLKVTAPEFGRTKNWRGLAAVLQCVTLYPVDPRTSENMRSENMPDLSNLEREVMQLIWAGGPLTAEFVRERLGRRLKESTVRTVLRRLEEKGYVNHTVDGRTYVYQATHPRGKVAANAVQRIIDLLCNGSVEEVLVGMVDNAMLDQRQLRTLADKVAKAKAGRR
jgi:BlaI family transcriptional regulator, penicillinase repressor